MKRLVTLALLSVLISNTSGMAGEKQFKIDPVHSSVQFRIRHLYSAVVGRFNRFEGTIAGDPEKPETLRVTASVDITSVDTANADRDKHLRAQDFFDTERYASATFTSVKTTLGDKKDSALVTGRLASHGVEKEIVFSTRFLGSGTDPRGSNHAGFYAVATINRVNFGVAYGATATNGIPPLGAEVELILDLDAVEVKPEGES